MSWPWLIHERLSLHAAGHSALLFDLVQLQVHDHGRVLAGIQVPDGKLEQFRAFLSDLSYPFHEEIGRGAGGAVEQAESSSVYLLAADAVLLLHVLFVAFVIGGLALILAGKARRWLWVRNPWFRLAHLLAIAVVVVQSWFGAICPLTTIEMMLRSRAGDSTYPGSFVAHWLETLLYYRAPAWAFVVCYTLFGAAVVGSWLWVRPRRFRSMR